MAKRNSGLGRGLDSLFLSGEQQISDASASSIRLSDIDIDPYQPRKTFEVESLEQLADSIKEHGVLQPIVVMPTGVGRYTIIAGERRFRRARMAGLSEIPAIVKDVSLQSAREIALIENLQREDLDPVEVAMGYRSLMEQFNLTQDEISKKLSIPRSTVANSLRVLKLPEDILKQVKNGQLTLGHAKVLLSVPDENGQKVLAKEIAEKKLSVRQSELAAKKFMKENKITRKAAKPTIVKEMELSLSEIHGTPVRITYKNGKGSINITFNSDDQLKQLTDLLGKN